MQVLGEFQVKSPDSMKSIWKIKLQLLEQYVLWKVGRDTGIVCVE